MRKINKTFPIVPVATTCICCLLGLLLWQGRGAVVGLKDRQEDHRLEVGVWTVNDVVEQTFIASHDDLCRIDVFVDSYYPWHSPYLEFRLFEIDTIEIPNALTYEQLSLGQTPIRTVRLNGWLLSSHMFNGITFEPVTNSSNKRYLLSLRSPGLKEGGMFILMASPKDSYKRGDLFINGEKREVDLSFRALYQRSLWQVAQRSAARLILQKPFPFSIPQLYPALLLLYGIMLISFCWLVIRQNG